MIDLISCIWLLIGGFLEPVWLIALKKSDNFKDKRYAAIAVFFMIASPFCLSMAMRTIPIGTAYAVWTGIGAICAVLFGAILYKERTDRIKIGFIFLIIVGVVGLALMEGA